MHNGKAYKLIVGLAFLLLTATLVTSSIFITEPFKAVGCTDDDLLLQNVMMAAAVQNGNNINSDGDKVVYLTFDDGPSKTTIEVLQILKDENIPATFFVTNADNNKEYFPLVKTIQDDGHCIALHSSTHKYSEIYSSPETFWQDIESLETELRNQGVTAYHILRFPGGSTNTVSNKYGGKGIMKTLSDQALEKDFTIVDWNVDSRDSIGNHRSVSDTYNNVIRGVSGKDIAVILMHDTLMTKNTAKALPDIIAWLKNAGYRFGTVNELQSEEAAKHEDLPFVKVN